MSWVEWKQGWGDPENLSFWCLVRGLAWSLGGLEGDGQCCVRADELQTKRKVTAWNNVR